MGRRRQYGVAHVKRTGKATALNCTFRTRYGYVGYDGDGDAPDGPSRMTRTGPFSRPRPPAYQNSSTTPSSARRSRFRTEVAATLPASPVVGDARSRASAAGGRV